MQDQVLEEQLQKDLLLKNIEETLPNSSFIRIHKSHIIHVVIYNYLDDIKYYV